jgi:hypothetical protein
MSIRRIGRSTPIIVAMNHNNRMPVTYEKMVAISIALLVDMFGPATIPLLGGYRGSLEGAHTPQYSSNRVTMRHGVFLDDLDRLAHL